MRGRKGPPPKSPNATVFRPSVPARTRAGSNNVRNLPTDPLAASRHCLPARGVRIARAAVAPARPAGRLLDRLARPDGHGLGRRLRHRLLLCTAHRAPRRACARLRRLCRVGRHRGAAHRADHRRVYLDPAARLHRLHHGRRLHGHRKLAEREGHQREPRHRLRPLHDGHLRLDHGRADDRRRRRREIGVAVHDHRHPVLPVAASRPRFRPPPTPSRCRMSRSTSKAFMSIRRCRRSLAC